MKFDFSYLDHFFAVLDQGQDINLIADTMGYQTIQKHVRLTGSEFSLENLKRSVKGHDNAGYGLRNLPQNVAKIRELANNLKSRTAEWQAVIEKNVGDVFKDYNSTNTVVCPVIGYDIGIGLDDVSCINLNSQICLEDIREVFSISIHETAHTVTSSLHGVYLDLTTKPNILKTINYLIPYEGIGIFSAYNYRLANNLPLASAQSLPTDDYNVSAEEYQLLHQNYRELVIMDQSESADKDDMLKKAFAGQRLTHRLGYALVYKAYQQKGIAEVRRIARMNIDRFAEEFLRV